MPQERFQKPFESVAESSLDVEDSTIPLIKEAVCEKPALALPFESGFSDVVKHTLALGKFTLP